MKNSKKKKSVQKTVSDNMIDLNRSENKKQSQKTDQFALFVDQTQQNADQTKEQMQQNIGNLKTSFFLHEILCL